MKKLLLFIVVLLVSFQSKAQFFNSIGITGGVSLSNQKFYYYDPDGISRKKYKFGFNGSLFLEMFSHDYIRWVSEIQFNQKGSKDKQPEATYRNNLQYLCWNNYLKIRTELFNGIPYILIGPRLEYKLTQNTASPFITGSFLQLHVTPAVGAGFEFISYSQWKFFVEAFYNPGLIMPSYITPDLHIRNKNFELRVGLKYEFGGRREGCNTPTYVD